MKKYKKHYEVHPEVNQKGKIRHNVVYKGEYYRYDLDETQLKKMKRTYILLLAAASVIQIGMGLINNPGSRRFAVALPYVIGFLPLVYAWLGAVRIMTSPKKMSYVDYDMGCLRLKRSAIGALVCSLLTLLGELIFWFMERGEYSLYSEWLFLMGGLFLSLIFGGILRLQRHFPCISEKKI